MSYLSCSACISFYSSDGCTLVKAGTALRGHSLINVLQIMKVHRPEVV